MNPTLTNFYHPASIVLLRQQFVARLLRIRNAFSNPRRKVLAVVGVVLGIAWLSQAIASVMLRESADPDQLRLWLPLGLAVYSVWHVVKISLRKPIEPFDWTPAERELVCAAPITRTQLISYRMASIVSAASIKAILFSVVMIPDLSVWVFGLVGMFLGLLLVDLIRVAYELFFHGLTKLGQGITRIVVVVSLVGIVGWALLSCFLSANSASEIASPGGLLFFQSLVEKLMGLTTSGIGSVLLMPFNSFTELMMAEGYSPSMMGSFVISFVLVATAGTAVYQLDRWSRTRQLKFEQQAFKNSSETRKTKLAKRQSKIDVVRVPWRLGGFGSLVWRQLLGAYHYRMTLLVSLGIPTVLCCIPLLAKHNPLMMLMNVVAGMVFYSFLLLPSALILDFRRDVDRFAVLKALPIHPFVVTIGQLAAPVIICSLFQWVVLVIAVVSGSVIAWHAIVAAVLLLPINTLIFAIENFAFMLAPYRRNREGVDVFLRTILTFTGKGILFALALAMTVGWAFASRGLCQAMDLPAATGVVFGVGAWSMACVVSAGFVLGIVRIYEKMDPTDVVT